jgi:hypothetical protein
MGTGYKLTKENRVSSSGTVKPALGSHRLGFKSRHPLLPVCATLGKAFTSLSLCLSSARRCEWMGLKLWLSLTFEQQQVGKLKLISPSLAHRPPETLPRQIGGKEKAERQYRKKRAQSLKSQPLTLHRTCPIRRHRTAPLRGLEAPTIQTDRTMVFGLKLNQLSSLTNEKEVPSRLCKSSSQPQGPMLNIWPHFLPFFFYQLLRHSHY